MFEEVVPVEVVRHFCHIATNRLGVGISSDHQALVAGRVAKRLQLLQVPLDEYMTRLEEDKDCTEVVGFLDFLRPRPPRFFARLDDHTALHERLVHWLKDGKRRIRLWSAGCGSGEEAYSMALTALAAVQAAEVSLDDMDIKILATDISMPMLDRGKQGIFADEQLRDVPPTLRDRYFHATEGGMAIDEDIKDMVSFRRLNLTRLPFPMTGPLEAIFCHEGLLPLVASVRQRLVVAVKKLLAKEGLLCTGLGELALAALDDDDLLDPESCGTTSIRHGHC
jgi:chemotaxis protein methyltransferase CheR